MPDPDRMSFLEHLDELRRRLVRVVLVFLVTTGAGIALTPRILALLLAPYGSVLRVLGPTEGVSAYLRIALTFGGAAAFPYVLFEIWGFIAPGLLPRERRYAYTIIPAAVVLFLTGAAFAWFILIPTAIRFLASFLPDVFQVQWTSERYIPFVTSLLFWVGICFELPLVAWFLARIRVVNARILLRVWRYAMVGIAILAAVITPTVDPFNMGLVAVPLALLYFVSVAVAALAQRKG